MSVPDGATFRELDRRHARAKGAAFRAFKRALDRLEEGVHFHRLDARGDAREIEALRAAGRIYAGTVNAVIVTARGCEALRESLAGPGGPGPSRRGEK